MKLGTWSVRARLSVAFGVLAAMVVGVSALSLYALHAANGHFIVFINGVYAQASTAAKIGEAVGARAIAARNMVLLTRADDLENEKSRVMDADRAVRTYLAELTELTAEAIDISDESRELIAKISSVESRYGPVAQRIVALALRGQREEAIKIMNEECRPLLAELASATQDYARLVEREALRLTENTTINYTEQRQILIGFCVFSILVACGSGLIITRSLLRALGAEPIVLSQAAKRVAQGDLRPLAGAKDATDNSVFSSLAMMQSSLATLVSQVQEASEAIVTGSAQIAAGNRDLSERTELQVSALHQTTSTMNDFEVTVQANANHAQQAHHLACDAASVAEQGELSVSEVVHKMRGIEGSAKRVTEIVATIDAIAFQTNILALNAAIEAVRAGEHGRGFAVVATEVRTLSQRSARAANEIKHLVAASAAQVEQGGALVDQAGRTMKCILESVHRLTRIVGEINAACMHQSAGIVQIGEAIYKIDNSTHQNAAMVEQSAAAAINLSRQAEHLAEAVSLFKLNNVPASAVQ
ncbi:methyl-accepting chemotaxis protein [Achromobacter sp. DH1f]|uniref:methyl-accepting chemotaxis protein n=1 Tax=Achromobacter sp. DH1f TaxID=1397275 RepID=UPI0009DEDA6B|nr:methyl-accepting chemotaxis protein [Achromobacter sp. DH1f]